MIKIIFLILIIIFILFLLFTRESFIQFKPTSLNYEQINDSVKKCKLKPEHKYNVSLNECINICNNGRTCMAFSSIPKGNIKKISLNNFSARSIHIFKRNKHLFFMKYDTFTSSGFGIFYYNGRVNGFPGIITDISSNKYLWCVNRHGNIFKFYNTWNYINAFYNRKPLEFKKISVEGDKYIWGLGTTKENIQIKETITLPNTVKTQCKTELEKINKDKVINIKNPYFTIGNSSTNVKTFIIPNGYYIDEPTLMKNNRGIEFLNYNFLNSDFYGYPDRFEINNLGNNKYSIKRLDSSRGWGQNLVIKITKYELFRALKTNNNYINFQKIKTNNKIFKYIYSVDADLFCIDTSGLLYKTNVDKINYKNIDLGNIGRVKKVIADTANMYCLNENNELFYSLKYVVKWKKIIENVIDFDTTDKFVFYINKDDKKNFKRMQISDICNIYKDKCKSTNINNNLDCNQDECLYNKIDISEKPLYMYKNMETNKCLKIVGDLDDTEETLKNNSRLQLDVCNQNDRNQHFFEYNGLIKSPYNNSCLTKTNNYIILDRCNNNDSNQKVKFQNEQLILNNTNLCIDSKNQTNLVFSENNFDNKQKFSKFTTKEIGIQNDEEYVKSKGNCVKKVKIDDIDKNLTTNSKIIDKDLNWRECPDNICHSFDKLRFGNGDTWKTRDVHGEIQTSEKLFGTVWQDVSENKYEYKDNKNCRTTCNEDENCQGFTETDKKCILHGYGVDYRRMGGTDLNENIIIKKGDNSSNNNQCYVKRQFVDKIYDPNFIVDKGRCNKLNISKEDTELELPYNTENTSLYQCKKKCIEDEKCKGLEYNNRLRMCNIFNIEQENQLPIYLSGKGDQDPNFKCYKSNKYINKPFVKGNYEVTFGKCKSNIKNTDFDSYKLENVDVNDTKDCDKICNEDTKCLGYSVIHDQNECIFHGNKDDMNNSSKYNIPGINPNNIDLNISSGIQENEDDKNRCHKSRNFDSIGNYTNNSYDVHYGKCNNIHSDNVQQSISQVNELEMCKKMCTNSINCQAFDYDRDNKVCNIYNEKDKNMFYGSLNKSNNNKLCFIKKTN